MSWLEYRVAQANRRAGGKELYNQHRRSQLPYVSLDFYRLGELGGPEVIVLRLNVLSYWVVEKIRVECGNGATHEKCCARLSVALAYHAR